MTVAETPATEPKLPVPDTVKRLHHLKSGEKMLVYRGDLQGDIDRMNSESLAHQVLAMIRDHAQQLERNGRIRLEKVRGSKPDDDYELIATGLPLPDGAV